MDTPDEKHDFPGIPGIPDDFDAFEVVADKASRLLNGQKLSRDPDPTDWSRAVHPDFYEGAPFPWCQRTIALTRPGSRHRPEGACDLLIKDVPCKRWNCGRCGPHFKQTRYDNQLACFEDDFHVELVRNIPKRKLAALFRRISRQGGEHLRIATDDPKVFHVLTNRFQGGESLPSGRNERKRALRQILVGMPFVENPLHASHGWTLKKRARKTPTEGWTVLGSVGYSRKATRYYLRQHGMKPVPLDTHTDLYELGPEWSHEGKHRDLLATLAIQDREWGLTSSAEAA